MKFILIFMVWLLVWLPNVVFATNINPWDATFNTSVPNDATNISDIDLHIINAKESTQARMDVDHAFSSLNATTTTNTGRHLAGTANVFVVTTDTACSTITAMTNPDNNASSALATGAVCIDVTDHEVCVYNSGWQCNTPATANVPTGAVFMFATACPTGYTDISAAHTGNMLRVIDTAAVANIPNTEATACTATGGECGAPTTAYSDTLTAVEMPAHTHTTPMSTTGSASPLNADRGGAVTTDNVVGSSTGGGGPHYHPSSYFRLCQKT